MCTSVNSEDLLERLAFSETISEKGGHQGHELVRFPTGSLRLRVHRWLSSAGSPSKHEALSVDSRDIPPRLTEKGTRSGPPANPSRELHAGCVQLRSISVPSRPPAHHTCHALGTEFRGHRLFSDTRPGPQKAKAPVYCHGTPPPAKDGLTPFQFSQVYSHSHRNHHGLSPTPVTTLLQAKHSLPRPLDCPLDRPATWWALPVAPVRASGSEQSAGGYNQEVRGRHHGSLG